MINRVGSVDGCIMALITSPPLARSRVMVSPFSSDHSEFTDFPFERSRFGALLHSLSRRKVYTIEMITFKLGDRVRWHREVLTRKGHLTGTICTVVADDQKVDESSVFEVEFAFGVRILRASQLVHVSSRKRSTH